MIPAETIPSVGEGKKKSTGRSEFKYVVFDTL
jgi:hypothetical protein